MTRLIPLALLFLLLAAIPVAAQQPARPEERKQLEERKQPTVSADGTEVFQYLLDRAKLKPIKANDVWNLGRMDDVIVIVLGNAERLRVSGHNPYQLANNVIQSGGAALVASDQSLSLATYFPNAQDWNVGHTRIPNGYVDRGNRTKPASLFMPDHSGNMPFAAPLPPPPNADGPEWELFKDLNRIATNRPSFIFAPNPRGEFGSRLASYPRDCKYWNDDDGDGGGVDQNKVFFALGNSGQQVINAHRRYRFLALADPSVFINQMMLANDENGRTDNLEFGARAVGYLAESDIGRRRSRCLLIQNGEVIEDYSALKNMMQPPLPLPNIMAMQDKITDFGNKVIDNFETNDVANKTLLGSKDEQRDERFKYIMRAVFVLLLLRAVWYAVRRTWIAKRPADGAPPPSGGLPATRKNDKPKGLFDRRQKELLRRNNIYEPVRVVIREMFLLAGAPEEPGKRLPEVEISDVVGQPDTLVDALTDLWKIAYGPARVVTVQRWKMLEPLFDRVRQAHDDGKWRFV